MMRPALASIVVVLTMSGVAWVAPPQSRSEELPGRLLLTDHAPRASASVPLAIVRATPPLVTIMVEKIDNPSKVQVDILVSLRWAPVDEASRGAGRTDIGTLSLFPADQPGTFTLRTSEVFTRLRETGVALEALRVSLDVELLAADSRRRTPGPVAVVIAEPAWMMKEPQ
jgi:hypothetical protein